MTGQLLPLPVQISAMQQPPPLQLFDEQQASPAPPQRAQVPLPGPTHTFDPVHCRPAQQVCPAPPQSVHIPPMQAPAEQAGAEAQQA